MLRVPPAGGPGALGAGADADRTQMIPRADDRTQMLPEAGAHRDAAVPDDAFGEGVTHGTRLRGWKRPALAAAAVFAVSMAGITAFELISGNDLSGGQGTTLSSVVRGGGDRDSGPADPAPSGDTGSDGERTSSPRPRATAPDPPPPRTAATAAPRARTPARARAVRTRPPGPPPPRRPPDPPASPRPSRRSPPRRTPATPAPANPRPAPASPPGRASRPRPAPTPSDPSAYRAQHVGPGPLRKEEDRGRRRDGTVPESVAEHAPQIVVCRTDGPGPAGRAAR